MKWSNKYCFQLPFLDKQFSKIYLMYKVDEIIYILPDCFELQNKMNNIICRLLFTNIVLGDVYKLSVSAGLIAKKDKVYQKYILPILNDYTKKNKIDLNYDFY